MRTRSDASTVRVSWLVLLATATVLGACSGEPDEEWAKEKYGTREAMIDGVESALAKEFEAFGPVPFAKLPEQGRDAAQAAQEKRSETFDAKALEILKKEGDIIGWEMMYSFPEVEDPVIPYGFAKASSHKPSFKGGTVRTDRRDVTVSDDRKLAWGLYQVPGEETKQQLGFSVPNYVKGFEVAVPIKKGDAVLDLKLFVVPRGEE